MASQTRTRTRIAKAFIGMRSGWPPPSSYSKTKARLAVIAYTGLPHSLIKRLRPEDVNLRAGTMIVSARRKGRGVERRSLVLTAEGVAALRRFADLDCWGSFSNNSVCKSCRRA